MRNNRKVLVYKALEDLQLSPSNARTHSQEQVQQIARSIEEFGFTNPVLIDSDGNVLAGHGRIEAARLIGQDKVPTLTLEGLSDAQRKAYLLADNKLAENAGWDLDVLKIELGGLRELDFDLSLTGFDISEIDDLLNMEQPGLTDEDEIPEVSESITQDGDLWELGRHKLICGDSESPEYVGKLLCGEPPKLMVTDPPYGVEYDAFWREEASLGARNTGTVENDQRKDWQDVYKNWSADVLYVWMSSLGLRQLFADMETVGYIPISLIIWTKPNFAISRGDYHWQHEPCLYSVKKGKTHNWQGSRKETTVWAIEQGCGENTGHSTEKPVECMERPMRNNMAKGDIVCDPFVGSGTSIIAAEKLGHAGLFMELNSNYCDIAVKRWEDYTGKTAVRHDARP